MPAQQPRVSKIGKQVRYIGASSPDANLCLPFCEENKGKPQGAIGKIVLAIPEVSSVPYRG